jgi:hypothetical protein
MQIGRVDEVTPVDDHCHMIDLLKACLEQRALQPNSHVQGYNK